MGKASLYLIFSILFLNNTPLHQLCKIPVLIQHYQEHRQLDENVDLLDFLSMHYWGNDLNDNDEDRDRQLPFKEFNAGTHLGLFLPTQKFSIITAEVFYPSVLFHVLRNEYLPDPSISSLFRPPKA